MKTLSIKGITGILAVLLLSITLISFTGCKAKKEAAERARQEQMRIDKAKNDLTAILNDNGSMTIEEKKAALEKIKEMNLTDPEVLELIKKVEASIAEEERKIKEEEERRKKEEENKKNNFPPLTDEEIELNRQLDKNFAAIIEASNNGEYALANAKITETLSMFTSPEAFVLIIVYRDSEVTDYDKPTTIGKYLNYLKDMKTYDKQVVEFKLNAQGKIEGIELMKKP